MQSLVPTGNKFVAELDGVDPLSFSVWSRLSTWPAMMSRGSHVGDLRVLIGRLQVAGCRLVRKGGKITIELPT